MGADPILKITLNAAKPLPDGYPKELRTIGDHLRKKRLDLGLYQEEVAQILGITTSNLICWELNQHGIRCFKYWPKIIAFLGYVPFEIETKTWRGKIKMYRKINGITQEQFTKLAKLDPTTISSIENGSRATSKKVLLKVSLFFEQFT